MRQILAMIAVLGLTALSSVAAGNDKNLYVVTHVDIAGGGNLLAEATSLLEGFATDSRQDPGVVRFEVLRQEGHANHFTIYEVWQTRQAFEAHLAAAHTKRFREKLQPVLGSPYREGLHRLL